LASSFIKFNHEVRFSINIAVINCQKKKLNKELKLITEVEKRRMGSSKFSLGEEESGASLRFFELCPRKGFESLDHRMGKSRK